MEENAIIYIYKIYASRVIIAMNLLTKVLVFFLDNPCLEGKKKRTKNRKEIFIQSFSSRIHRFSVRGLKKYSR